jgi:hypothetical protein
MPGFGRKGLEQYASQGSAPPQGLTGLDALRNTARGPYLTQPQAGEVTRKVDVFLAAERAQRSQEGVSDAAGGSRGTDRPERSVMMAYLLWFILGQVSAHRFYLGAYRSACAQVGLFAFWLFVALGTPQVSYDTVGPVLAIAMIVWMLWVLGDVFFIHRIHRKLCRKPGEAAAAFA